MLNLKRAYDTPHKGDGARVLIDRLWPRGLTKRGSKIYVWLKEIAPSTKLRLWFNHDPKKWAAFRRRYSTELRKNKTEVGKIRALIKEHKIVTLLYGAKDERHNHAVVLRDFLS